jgi:HlyD family secretion protein
VPRLACSARASARNKSRIDLQRDEQLARQDFIAPAKLDADRLALQAAQRAIDEAAQTRHVAQHELETVRTALTVVRAPAAADARSFALRSPVAGRVLRSPGRGCASSVGAAANWKAA